MDGLGMELDGGVGESPVCGPRHAAKAALLEEARDEV